MFHFRCIAADIAHTRKRFNVPHPSLTLSWHMSTNPPKHTGPSVHHSIASFAVLLQHLHPIAAKLLHDF
jgi:hypothetical protein